MLNVARKSLIISNLKKKITKVVLAHQLQVPTLKNSLHCEQYLLNCEVFETEILVPLKRMTEKKFSGAGYLLPSHEV